MEEIWKDINGFEGLYQISNLGRVRSLGNNKNRKEKILKPYLNTKGYPTVGLHKNGKRKNYSVHRLVYETFIGEIPEGMQVNHKDENKQNNILSNIDTLMTCKENINWGTRNERSSKSLSKSVIQKTLQGEIIKIWPSIMEIERQLGYSNQNISCCCKGGYFDKSRGKWVNLNTAYGYIWQYER